MQVLDRIIIISCKVFHLHYGRRQPYKWDKVYSETAVMCMLLLAVNLCQMENWFSDDGVSYTCICAGQCLADPHPLTGA